MRKTEVLTSKVTEGSGTNGNNLINISIPEEEEGEGKECFDEYFDDEVLDLRQKRKQEVSLEQTNRENLQWDIILEI